MRKRHKTRSVTRGGAPALEIAPVPALDMARAIIGMR